MGFIRLCLGEAPAVASTLVNRFGHHIGSLQFQNKAASGFSRSKLPYAEGSFNTFYDPNTRSIMVTKWPVVVSRYNR